MSMRFSFDLGTNSLGWAVFHINEENSVASLENTGVRVFSNSRGDKTYTPLNQGRTEARSARRRRDRYLHRKERLLCILSELGFFPTDVEEKQKLQLENPYQLRAEALDKKLTLYQIGRAFFHINQRRGFKSNRLSNEDDESGKVKPVIKQVQEELEKNNCKSLGIYLYKRYIKKETVRAKSYTPGKTDYALYFSRKMYEDEFDCIWETQKEFHNKSDVFSKKSYNDIKDIIFHQRPLKPQIPGMCLFEDEQRCPWALPIAQEFRILQDLNNIRVIYNSRKTEAISMEQREYLFSYLDRKSSSCTPEEISKKIKSVDKIEGNISINFEKVETKKFKNNETSAVMRKILGKEKDWWSSMDNEKQTSFIKLLLDTKLDDESLEKKLCEEWHLTKDMAEHCIKNIVTLPKGYCSLSEKALNKIVPALKEEIITYDKAVEKAGYGDHRLILKTGYKILPYYGEILERYCIGQKSKEVVESLQGRVKQEARYGKITNPTVHVGLNQLQLVVNELIRRYGKPRQMILELARDLPMGKLTKSEYEKNQKENQKRNDRIVETIVKDKDMGVINPSRADIEKYKLWEELGENPADRRCPYTNKKITEGDVFSPKTHVDHILPFSRTLDNSYANKILCFVDANYEKKEKTPYEAWGHIEHRWRKIHDNSLYLPRNKHWRFQSDAMKKFEQGFLKQQLEATQYFSKVSQYYLSCLSCDNDKIDVWAIPGKLTAWLRYRWGLHTLLGSSEKNRNNHKHHAVDAVVIGCTDRSILKRVADWVSNEDEANRNDFSRKHRDSISIPWEGMRDDVSRSIEAMYVSHKADRGISGQLLEEQAYGLLPKHPENKGKEGPVLRYVGIHKNIFDLTEPMIKRIASPKTRQLIESYCEKAGEIKKAMQLCLEETGIRKVKIIKKETMVPIKDRQGNYYKGYASAKNWAFEIYEDDEGKWQGEMITRYDANQKHFIPRWRKDNPHKKMIMRLHNNDTIAMDYPNKPKGTLYRVCKMSGNIDICIAELHEANDASRGKEARISIKALSHLQEWNMQKIHMSPTGLIRYVNR